MGIMLPFRRGLMGKNKRKPQPPAIPSPPPPPAAAPAPAAASSTPPALTRQDLAIFCALAVALVALVMWRPLTRGEIALDMASALNFEPFRSFKGLAAQHDALLARPWFGQAWTLTDAAWSFYPNFLFAARELARGVLPLWSPFGGCGAPFLGNQLSAVFDPFQLPFYLLRSPWVYNLDPFLRLSFAGFFAFLFARRAGFSRNGSYFAAAFSMLTPSLYQFWSIPCHARAVALLPALLWVTETYVQEKSGRALLDLAALVAVSVFFGGAELSVETYFQAGLYLLVRLYQDPASSGAEKRRLVLRYVAFAASAALLSAVHWLPALEFVRNSTLAFERTGYRWKDLPIFTRALSVQDFLPLGAALAAGLGAWKVWSWLRRRGESASMGKTAAALAALAVCVAFSLLVMLILGMDETFVKVFLPAPHPPVRYSNEIPLGGLVVAALGLFAWLDSELPVALGALLPGCFLAFAWAERVPGFSHLLGALPGLSLGYSFYQTFMPPPLFAFWAAWGVERLLRSRSAPWNLRLRRAVIFAAAALVLAMATWGALSIVTPARVWLLSKVDLGLSPETLKDVNGAPLFGFMGMGRQNKLFPFNMVTGWFKRGLPMSDFRVGIKEGVPEEPAWFTDGDSAYFVRGVIGPGEPVARFNLPDGPREVPGPRFDVVPILGVDFQIAKLLIPAAVAAVVAGLLLPGAAWPAFLAAAFALGELLLMTVFYVPSIPKELMLPKNAAAELLAKDQSPWRFWPKEPGNAVMPPIAGSVFGWEDFRADIAVGSRRAAAFRALAEDYAFSPEPQKYFAGYSLLELANVKYLFGHATDILDKGRFEKIFEEGNLKIFRDKRAAPRAVVYEQAVTIPLPDIEAAVAPLDAVRPLRSFIEQHPDDLARTLVLHDDSTKWAAPAGPGPAAAPREAKIVRRESGRIELEAEAPRGGWLFLSDIYFPGWTAKVDGRERPIAPAWEAFRAVGLEPGHHRVVFEYKPRSFLAALLVSLAGWAVWLLVFLRLARRAGGGFLAAPGEWLVEGIVLVELAWWFGWTVFHWLR